MGLFSHHSEIATTYAPRHKIRPFTAAANSAPGLDNFIFGHTFSAFAKHSWTPVIYWPLRPSSQHSTKRRSARFHRFSTSKTARRIELCKYGICSTTKVEAHEMWVGLERAPMQIRACAASLVTLRERLMWSERWPSTMVNCPIFTSHRTDESHRAYRRTVRCRSDVDRKEKSCRLHKKGKICCRYPSLWWCC